MSGYIPEGGVWTAEERTTASRACGYVASQEIAETSWLKKADATVAALVAAGDDLADCLADALKRAGDATDEENEIVSNARALLDAVKGGGK